MSVLDADENSANFLSALHEKSGGNTALVISMYEIGETIGLDRDVAQKTAESLMGEGLVEIKTLSGGIGITENGIKEMLNLKGELDDLTAISSTLSGAAIIGDGDRKLIESVILSLKNAIAGLKLGFDALADLIVDIRTIELQLTSTSPKTSIFRECFLSIKERLEKAQNPGVLKQVKNLLGK